MQQTRHIPLEGASNFRDFGGYPTAGGRTVKWRRLFRSDHLYALTPADYENIADHGIRLVCDLRREHEVSLAPTKWPGHAAPEILNLPLLDAGPSTAQRLAADKSDTRDADWSRGFMRELYSRLVTQPVPLTALERIFTRLAAPDAFPTVIHCTAGKDRTGVTCALILSALGVSRQDVIDDFMLTARYYEVSAGVRHRISQAVEDSEMGGLSGDALEPVFGVERSYIETTLAHVDEAGGIEAFLTQKAGVAPEALQRLRDRLLD